MPTSWVAVHRCSRKKKRRICEVGHTVFFTFCGRRSVHGNKCVRCTKARKAVGPRDPDNKCMCVVQEARSLATFVAGDTRPRIRKEEADDVSCTEAPARCNERENVYWTHCVLILIAPMLRCRSSSCRRFCFLNETSPWHCYEKNDLRLANQIPLT